jgi:multimeric flavodoxin WrbA
MADRKIVLSSPAYFQEVTEIYRNTLDKFMGVLLPQAGYKVEKLGIFEIKLIL